MQQIHAADFRTRIHLQFLQVVRQAGLAPQAFELRSSQVATPDGSGQVETIVTVRLLPDGFSSTYASTKGRSWTFGFRNDVRAGKYDQAAP